MVKHISIRSQVVEVTFLLFRFGGGLVAFGSKEPPDDAEEGEAQDKNASKKEKKSGDRVVGDFLSFLPGRVVDDLVVTALALGRDGFD